MDGFDAQFPEHSLLRRNLVEQPVRADGSYLHGGPIVQHYHGRGGIQIP